MMCAPLAEAFGDGAIDGAADASGDALSSGDGLGVGVGVGDGVGDGEAFDFESLLLPGDGDGDGEPSVSLVTLKRIVQENPCSSGHARPFGASANANDVKPFPCALPAMPFFALFVGDGTGVTLFCCALCGLIGGLTPPGADVPPEPKLP